MTTWASVEKTRAECLAVLQEVLDKGWIAVSKVRWGRHEDRAKPRACVTVGPGHWHAEQDMTR